MSQVPLKTPLYDYYLKKRDDKKTHREALIAVARKLVHIVYAVLTKQEPYNPQEITQRQNASQSNLDKDSQCIKIE